MHKGLEAPMNKQTETLDWVKLERLDWHLWLLATLLIFILGIGLLSFMFPTSFWFIGSTPAQQPQRAFFGFCILLGLVLVYLLQRQAALRGLKRQLFEAQRGKAAAEQEAAAQVFLALPGLAQFRDALAMEYRRASTSGTHLAEVLLKTPNSSPDALGRMAKVLRCMVRHGEALYRISDKAIAVILPGMQLRDAVSFAGQLESLSGMREGELEVILTAYPDEVSSLAELDGKFRAAVESSAA